MIAPVNDAAIPAAVRAEGGEDTYKAALGFESALLDKLAEQLMRGSGLEDSPYAGTITDAFSAGLLKGGGIGLSEDLYKGFALQSSQAPPSGRRHS